MKSDEELKNKNVQLYQNPNTVEYDHEINSLKTQLTHTQLEVEATHEAYNKKILKVSPCIHFID